MLNHHPHPSASSGMDTSRGGGGGAAAYGRFTAAGAGTPGPNVPPSSSSSSNPTAAEGVAVGAHAPSSASDASPAVRLPPFRHLPLTSTMVAGPGSYVAPYPSSSSFLSGVIAPPSSSSSSPSPSQATSAPTSLSHHHLAGSAALGLAATGPGGGGAAHAYHARLEDVPRPPPPLLPPSSFLATSSGAASSVIQLPSPRALHAVGVPAMSGASHHPILPATAAVGTSTAPTSTAPSSSSSSASLAPAMATAMWRTPVPPSYASLFGHGGASLPLSGYIGTSVAGGRPPYPELTLGGVGGVHPSLPRHHSHQLQQPDQGRHAARLMKVVARLENVGTVAVVVAATGLVAEAISLIEAQVRRVHGLKVEIAKLSDIHGVDLVPSYELGKLLDADIGRYSKPDTVVGEEETHVVDVHYRRLDNDTATERGYSTNTADSPRSANRSTTSAAVSASAVVPAPASSHSVPSTSSSASSSSTASPRYAMQLSFVESAPSSVLQNKEFSFTVAFSFQAGSESEQAWSSEGATKMLRVTTTSESGEAVSPQNISVRVLKLKERSKNMVGVFMRLRVNSYYGRKRYLIRVQSSDPNWRSNVITSEPITVISKKIKRRTKKARAEPGTESATAEENSTISAG